MDDPVNGQDLAAVPDEAIRRAKACLGEGPLHECSICHIHNRPTFADAGHCGEHFSEPTILALVAARLAYIEGAPGERIVRLMS